MFSGHIVILIGATLWCGLIIGVSFIAAQAKFKAPTLTLAAALDVGRQTFTIFNRVEWAIFSLLLVQLLWVDQASIIAAALLALGAALMVQTWFVLPVLGQRVEAHMSGAPLPPSSDHFTYAALEVAKLLIILCLIAHCARDIV